MGLGAPSAPTDCCGGVSPTSPTKNLLRPQDTPPHFVAFQVLWRTGIFKNLHDIFLDNDFMSTTPKAQTTKTEIHE